MANLRSETIKDELEHARISAAGDQHRSAIAQVPMEGQVLHALVFFEAIQIVFLRTLLVVMGEGLQQNRPPKALLYSRYVGHI